MLGSTRRHLVACLAMTGLMVLATSPAEAQSSRKTDKGMAAKDIDPSGRGVISGVGIEGRDIIAMTDRMMRDMLSSPQLAGRATAPRVIIDDQYFRNDSSQRINKAMITDRLRVGLNRAAQGRMLFVGREFADMVAQERALKRDGVTDAGTTGLTHAQAGADFRLTGRISSLDTAQTKTGVVQRYNQIIFEMIDLENGITVWSNVYEFERAAADDLVYR